MLLDNSSVSDISEKDKNTAIEKMWYLIIKLKFVRVLKDKRSNKAEEH